MREISQDILDTLGVSEIRPFYLLNMTIINSDGDEVDYRYTDCDIPLWMPDPDENYLLYTEEPEGSSKLSIAEDSITFTELTRNETIYVNKYKGVDFFGESFTHQFHFNISSSSDSGSILYAYAVSNMGGGIQEDIALDCDAIVLQLYKASTSITIFLSVVSEGFSEGYTGYGYDLDTDYYCTIFRDESVPGTYGYGEVTLFLYSDSARTVLVDSITAQPRFKFIDCCCVYGLSTRNDDKAYEITGVVSGLNLLGKEEHTRIGFRYDSVGYSTGTIVDKCIVEIDTIDQVLVAAFVGGTSRGCDIGLRLILLDDDLGVVGDESFTLFSGEIDSYVLDPDEKISVTMTNMFTRWNQRTLATHSSSCRWKSFKGDECQYVGAETKCDRTYAQCVLYGNTDNFGGFRWLPSIEDKVVWWGKVPKHKKE